LNWKMFIASHWKVGLLMLQIGLFILMLPLGDLVDSPVVP